MRSLPHSFAVILATWTGYVMGPSENINFHVSGIPGSVTFPDSPGYAAGDDAYDLRPLHAPYGSGYCSVIRGWCGLPSEASTMSNIKAMYR